jgi:hypothetical protein
MHTIFGLFAILGLGFDSVEDVTTALSLTLPFPIYLLGLKSLRLATVLLWLFFAAQWANRCLIGHPVFINPFDSPFGGTLFFAIALVQVGYLLLSKALDKRKLVRLSEAFTK